MIRLASACVALLFLASSALAVALLLLASGTFAANTGQVTIGTTPVQIVPPRSQAGRTVTIVTVNAGATVYVGFDATVTPTTGQFVAGTITITTPSALYGVVSSGTQPVSFLDNF